MIEKPHLAQGWWRDLQPDADRPGDRAALARLRRCATLAEAMGEQASILLFQRVRAGGPWDLPAVAATAAVLAHVREDAGSMPGGVARHVGPASAEDPATALLKPLRLRRLMEAAGPGEYTDDLLTAFRRLVALAGGVLPVQDLSASMLDWCDGERGERRRRRWVYDYWNAGQLASPGTVASATASITEDAPG